MDTVRYSAGNRYKAKDNQKQNRAKKFSATDWDGAKTMEFWSPRNSEKVAHGRFPLGGE